MGVAGGRGGTALGLTGIFEADTTPFCPGALAQPRSDPNTPGADSAMSERAAAIEAAALDVAVQLAEKQRELNRRRREAAVAAKAALVEQMRASIAEIDTEILVDIFVLLCVLFVLSILCSMIWGLSRSQCKHCKKRMCLLVIWWYGTYITLRSWASLCYT